MNRSLKNKVVVVTGGANGIGCEIADKYLQNGAKVAILLDIDEIQGAETVKTLADKHGKGKVDFIKCDVTTDLEQVSKNIFDNYKTVDVAVMSAGVADASVPKRMIDINITAVIEWSLKFQEHMRKDNGGCGGTILLLSSIFGFRGTPYGPVYSATKFAVSGFTKSLGHMENFEDNGVRVLALCPGFTKSRLTEPYLNPKVQETLPDNFVKFLKDMPWQKVEDVGNAAVEVYERADSGTLWLVEGGKPIEEVL